MKNNFVAFSLILLPSITLSFASYTSAEGVTNDDLKSGVSITITERTLSLDDATIPKFKPVTVTDKKMTLTPTNDFSVTVSDKRNELRRQWTLYYTVSILSNDDGETVPDQQFSIGKGTVVGLSDTSYEALDVNITPYTTEPMLRVNEATKTTYEYIVPKKEISLSLGANTKPGDYTAKQTLFLASLPVSQ